MTLREVEASRDPQGARDMLRIAPRPSRAPALQFGDLDVPMLRIVPVRC